VVSTKARSVVGSVGTTPVCSTHPQSSKLMPRTSTDSRFRDLMKFRRGHLRTTPEIHVCDPGGPAGSCHAGIACRRLSMERHRSCAACGLWQPEAAPRGKGPSSRRDAGTRASDRPSWKVKAHELRSLIARGRRRRSGAATIGALASRRRFRARRRQGAADETVAKVTAAWGGCS
jgi:hypothetical protein